VNAHFIQPIWCSLPLLVGVGTPFPYLFLALQPWI